MDAQRIQKRNYSRKRGKGSHFGIGDKVMKKDFRRTKRAGGALDPKWLGPYEVMKDNGKDLFLVKRCDDGKVDRAHGDEIMQYEDSVSQPNAIGNATLQEQLYSSSLL